MTSAKRVRFSDLTLNNQFDMSNYIRFAGNCIKTKKYKCKRNVNMQWPTDNQLKAYL